MFLFLFAGFWFLNLHMTQKFLKGERNTEARLKRFAILSKYRKMERFVFVATIIGYVASSLFKLEVSKWVFLLSAILTTLINFAKYVEAKKA